MLRRMSAALRAAAGIAFLAVLGLGALAPIASAAPAAGATPAALQAKDQTCHVNGDGVRYREGPGENFKALGTANRGQQFDAYGPRENGYANGTVTGVMGNVWISERYLDC